jgi:hypothetical protein
LEARLGAALSATMIADAAEDAELTTNGLAAVRPEAGAPNAWPDESAEVAMLSELNERGEKPALTATEPVEETDTSDLPPLDELVRRLSPEVRATLDDLFRVRFIAVRRVPQNVLHK